MDYEVIWTAASSADLEEAVRQAAERDPTYAEALRDELLQSVEILSRLPFIGPTYERDRTGRSREILCRRYRIFYRVRESERRVEIVAVWHASRRDPRLPG